MVRRPAVEAGGAAPHRGVQRLQSGEFRDPSDREPDDLQQPDGAEFDGRADDVDEHAGAAGAARAASDVLKQFSLDRGGDGRSRAAERHRPLPATGPPARLPRWGPRPCPPPELRASGSYSSAPADDQQLLPASAPDAVQPLNTAVVPDDGGR